MQDGSIPYHAVMGLLCLSMLTVAGGCAGKRVASTSGDQSALSGEKPAAAPVETISPERMVTIPEEQPPSTVESARAPLAEAPSTATPEDVSTLDDIFFDFDQSVIRSDAQGAMEANAARINNTPGKSILIEGHCDERGTLAYNLVLGEKRARSAQHYLEDLGVSASRLKIISYGEVKPLCREREERCWQKNRRAHFVVQ
jgi:peptidoglycan-associated lipoprotein